MPDKPAQPLELGEDQVPSTQITSTTAATTANTAASRLRRRPEESSSGPPLPRVEGPLAIFREDLERVWDILAAAFAEVHLTVRARGHGYDAEDVAALAARPRNA